MIEKSNNEIQMYLHCKECITDFHNKKYAIGWNRKYAIGWTKVGIQVWCETHNINMIHINFEGQQHPTVTYCKPKKERRSYVKH